MNKIDVQSRLVINLDPEADKALREMAGGKGQLSMAELIRRLIIKEKEKRDSQNESKKG